MQLASPSITAVVKVPPLRASCRDPSILGTLSPKQFADVSRSLVDSIENQRFYFLNNTRSGSIRLQKH
jgi:hypothetical protein